MIRSVAIIAVALLMGCQYSEQRYLGRSVSGDELHGQWVATPFAMKSLSDVGFERHLDAEEHRLRLQPDGTCRLQTFVSHWEHRRDNRWIDPDVPCRWKLGSSGEHQEVSIALEFQDGAVEQRYYLDEDDHGLILWQYVTDPDAWRYMEFAKRD